MTTAAIVFVINIITSIFKDFVYPKFGATGVHAIVFVLATIGALFVTYGGQYPGLTEIIAAAAAIFSLAVAFYEVLLKKFDAFGPIKPIK